jgi:hypothetical protein
MRLTNSSSLPGQSEHGLHGTVQGDGGGQMNMDPLSPASYGVRVATITVTVGLAGRMPTSS